MNLPLARGKKLRFGLFEVDLEERFLAKKGVRIKLQEKPFQILALLLERPGEVVSRDELKAELWQADTFVEFDDGLNTAIKKLRIALDDSSDNPVYIETIPRRGYRFLAPVQWESDLSPLIEEQAAGVLSQQAEAPLPVPSQTQVTPGRWHPWLLISIAAFALLGTGLAVFFKGRAKVRTAMESIIVLPLENLSGDPSQEVLAEGITDQLTTNLAKLGHVRVISRTSAMRYKGAHRSASEIAHEVHIDGIVEGTVERIGDRVRIRTQLIYAPTDQRVWAESYDRDLRDVLQLENEVAQTIAAQISASLPRQGPVRAARHRPIDPQAYEEYLQAHYFWKERTTEAIAKAVEHFNRAIERDPDYAEAYAGLANCYVVLPMLSTVPRENAHLKARQAAEKAIALDDSLAGAHLAVAEVRLYDDWDFPGAEKEFKRTLELNPNYAQGHQWYAEFLSLMSRHSEAIAEIQTAQQLDPLSMIIYHQAGQIYQGARRYDEASEQYRKALQIQPGFGPTYSALAILYRRQRNYPANLEAQRQANSYWDSGGTVLQDLNKIAEAYRESGERGYGLAMVDFEKKHPGPIYYRAWNYGSLGDHEQALYWLQKSLEARELQILGLQNDPEFDSLRADPRLQAIVKAIGFKQP